MQILYAEICIFLKVYSFLGLWNVLVRMAAGTKIPAMHIDSARRG